MDLIENGNDRGKKISKLEEKAIKKYLNREFKKYSS